METTQCYDVIIVGAGISGLSAAKLLTEKGLKILVLEARDRVGGRTFTKRDPIYKYCDVGGSYVGPTQNRILRLGNDLGLKTYKVNAKGDFIHYSKGKATRFNTTWPKFRNPFAYLDVIHLFRTIDKLTEEIPLANPWDAPRANEWDNTTMKEFYDKMCWTAEAKEYGRAFVSVHVTMEPAEISMLWFLWYVACGDKTKRSWEVENGGQERKFIGGSNQVTEIIAKRLRENLKLNQPVGKITESNNRMHVESIHGDKYQAKYVILAISPALYLRITFEPPLSPIKNQLVQRVPMGSCIKTNVFYKKAFWRDMGLNGFISAADGIQVIGNSVDDTKPDGSLPALTGFVVAEKAREMAQLTREERKKKTIECYVNIFGTEEARNVIAYEENNWLAEPYSGGCYVSTYPPGVMTQFGREIRTPHGNVYFAGTETACWWPGYMDGAVEAGERASREVLHAKGLIPESQIWQKEPIFQDCPELPFEDTFMEKYAPSIDTLVSFIKWTGYLTAGGFIIYVYTQR